jgi:hypothetical protein
LWTHGRFSGWFPTVGELATCNFALFTLGWVDRGSGTVPLVFAILVANMIIVSMLLL